MKNHCTAQLDRDPVVVVDEIEPQKGYVDIVTTCVSSQVQVVEYASLENVLIKAEPGVRREKDCFLPGHDVNGLKVGLDLNAHYIPLLGFDLSAHYRRILAVQNARP